MRTTITLEADVEALVRRTMAEKGLSFKDAVNSALRSAFSQPRPNTDKFVQKTYSLGSQDVGAMEKALQLSSYLEDVELIAKLDPHR